MKSFKYFKKLYITHRGIYNNIDTMENSMEAFSIAINQNMPIEFDVRMLKDETLIIFHDKSLKRLTKCVKYVSNLKIDDLVNITLGGTKSKIPLLSDVLKLVDGKVLLDIELKGQKHSFKFIRNIINVLDCYKGKFIVKSFNPLYMLLIRLYRKEYFRGLLLNKTSLRMPLNLYIVKPDFICCDKNLISNNKIQNYIIKHSCLLFCYNVKNKEEAKSLNSDGFIIDGNIKKL